MGGGRDTSDLESLLKGSGGQSLLLSVSFVLPDLLSTDLSRVFVLVVHLSPLPLRHRVSSLALSSRVQVGPGGGMNIPFGEEFIAFPKTISICLFFQRERQYKPDY